MYKLFLYMGVFVHGAVASVVRKPFLSARHSLFVRRGNLVKTHKCILTIALLRRRRVHLLTGRLYPYSLSARWRKSYSNAKHAFE